MSNVLFPDICIGYEFVRKPIFSTKIMTSTSGRELRARNYAIPRYEFNLQIPLMREAKGELKKIEDFFLDRFGSFDSFLFKAPFDNEFESEFVGDGVTTVFQLFKQTGEQKIPITNVEAFGSVLMWNQNNQVLMWDENDQVLMWTNAVYSVSSDGVVTMTEPLAVGQRIVFKGTFYYRCRFADDAQEFTLFSYRLWRGEVNLVGSFGDKI